MSCKKSVLLAGFLLSLSFAQHAPGQVKPVKIDSGLLSGEAAGENKDVRVYKGIPYAAPPVGKLRWHNRSARSASVRP